MDPMLPPRPNDVQSPTTPPTKTDPDTAITLESRDGKSDRMSLSSVDPSTSRFDPEQLKLLELLVDKQPAQDVVRVLHALFNYWDVHKYEDLLVYSSLDLGHTLVALKISLPIKMKKKLGLYHRLLQNWGGHCFD